jgi:hypothetical protein
MPPTDFRLSLMTPARETGLSAEGNEVDLCSGFPDSSFFGLTSRVLQ